MKQKLMIFTFLLMPIAAFGQSNSTSDKPTHEFTVNIFTVSGRVDHIDHFFSTELRWGVNDKLNDIKVSYAEETRKLTTTRFVPGFEFEYLEDSTKNETVSVKRYSRLVWLKGYLDFRAEKKLRPYVGGAVGWDIETVKVSTDNATESINNNGPTIDFLSGIHFYANKRVVLSVSTRAWRPSVNFGLGFTF